MNLRRIDVSMRTISTIPYATATHHHLSSVPPHNCAATYLLALARRGYRFLHLALPHAALPTRLPHLQRTASIPTLPAPHTCQLSTACQLASGGVHAYRITACWPATLGSHLCARIMPLLGVGRAQIEGLWWALGKRRPGRCERTGGTSGGPAAGRTSCHSLAPERGARNVLNHNWRDEPASQRLASTVNRGAPPCLFFRIPPCRAHPSAWACCSPLAPHFVSYLSQRLQYYNSGQTKRRHAGGGAGVARTLSSRAAT